MFKRRRRAAGSTSTDLPFCAMCGQGIRLDAETGRCALGHRVATPSLVTEPTTPEVATADLTAGDYVDERIAAFTADRTYDPYAELSDQAPVWDTAADATQPANGLEDFISWNDESAAGGPSALDFDTAEMPVAESAGLLGELDGAVAFADRTA